MKTDKVTRLEVIDNNGRAYVRYDVDVEYSIQDEGKTLKIFVKDNGKKEVINQILEGLFE